MWEVKGDQGGVCPGGVGAAGRTGFSTKKGSGHALERLRRSSATRPQNVTGGKRTVKASAPAAAPAVDPKRFDVPMTPLLKKLQGEWLASELVTNGEPMNSDWLASGSRTTHGKQC